jgi:periplasmic copper chaperone A
VHHRIKLGCLVALLLLGISGGAESRAGDLIVTDAWSRPTPPEAKVAVVYFSISNHGNRADRLVALSTPIAGKVELHESHNEHGVIEMRAVGGLECPPGATVAAGPNGVHGMLLGLRRPLIAGTSFSLALQFRDAGAVTVPVAVRASDATVAQ